MRYRLRTLLIVLALLPPLMAVGWAKWAEYRAAQQRKASFENTARQVQRLGFRGSTATRPLPAKEP